MKCKCFSSLAKHASWLITNTTQSLNDHGLIVILSFKGVYYHLARKLEAHHDNRMKDQSKCSLDIPRLTANN